MLNNMICMTTSPSLHYCLPFMYTHWSALCAFKHGNTILNQNDAPPKSCLLFLQPRHTILVKIDREPPIHMNSIKNSKWTNQLMINQSSQLNFKTLSCYNVLLFSDDWIPVLKTSAGTSQDSFSLWTSSLFNSFMPSCMYPLTENCSEIFKHQLAELWNLVNIHQVNINDN